MRESVRMDGGDVIVRQGKSVTSFPLSAVGVVSVDDNGEFTFWERGVVDDRARDANSIGLRYLAKASPHTIADDVVSALVETVREGSLTTLVNLRDKNLSPIPFDVYDVYDGDELIIVVSSPEPDDPEIIAKAEDVRSGSGNVLIRGRRVLTSPFPLRTPVLAEFGGEWIVVGWDEHGTEVGS